MDTVTILGLVLAGILVCVAGGLILQAYVARKKKLATAADVRHLFEERSRREYQHHIGDDVIEHTYILLDDGFPNGRSLVWAVMYTDHDLLTRVVIRYLPNSQLSSFINAVWKQVSKLCGALEAHGYKADIEIVTEQPEQMPILHTVSATA